MQCPECGCDCWKPRDDEVTECLSCDWFDDSVDAENRGMEEADA